MSDFFPNREELNRGSRFTLDFKRVIARAIRFWYVIILILAASIIIAFYNTRYSQRVYPVSASLIVREMQDVSGAELLYNNPLINQHRNYLNEPYIIRSLPLVEKVIQSNNFNVAFYREGYFLTTEAYSYIPVKAEWCHQRAVKNGEFIFKLKNEQQYSISAFGSSETEKTYILNDTINYNGFDLCIKSIPGRSINQFINVPFLLVISDARTVANSYISRLKVEWVEEGAGVMNLSLTGTNPEKEVDFLFELIKAYQQLDLQKKNEAAERSIAFIKEQLIGIQDSLKTVEYQLEKFGKSSRVKDMSMEAQRLFAKVEAFEIQKSELLIRKNYLKHLRKYLDPDQQHSLDQIILPSSVGLEDPILNGLISNMVNTQLELKGYAGVELGNNPMVKERFLKIQEIKKSILESIVSTETTDNIKLEYLQSQLNQIDKQLSDLPLSERQLIAVQRNYSLLENLYVFLMQKLSEAGISRSSNTSDIIPVNPPMIGSVLSPVPLYNYSIGILLGLAIPIGIFILFEILNTKIQSKEDIEKITTIPFVGGVGHNSFSTSLPVKDSPKSGLSESFRALRSNLNFFTGNQSKKIFMITSSISGEGKTFTTTNLAAVFALSGRKTLIVGADMRRPKIFQDFNRDNSVGLSTYLSGISQFEEIVQSTDIDNLFLISGGPVPPNPSELLLTSKFEEFIKSAIQNFDFVLIDTPPLALVTDAFVISKFADHTVFVMRQNYSPKDFVQSIDEYYRSGKITNISILLNDIYKSGLGYGYGQGYSYQYGYGYGYGYYGTHGGYYSDEEVKKGFLRRWFKR